eukprot:gene99-139_t
MAVRNLTRKFLEIRNGAKANRMLLNSRDDKEDTTSDSELLTGLDSSNSGKIAKSVPPVWLDKVERFDDDVSKIQFRMRDLSTLHNKRLLVNFESDETTQEREIDIVTQDITELFRDAEGILKQFGAQPNDQDISTSDKTVRGNMQRSMAKKLQGLSFNFRSSQKEYLRRLQAQKSGSGSQAFEFLGENKKKSDLDFGFNSAQIQMVDETEELVNQRDEEITRIAKSIEELAQIFKELAVLVIDQGTILDRIDYNMEQAVEVAKTGIKQLEQAEDSQKNALSYRCIIALIILISIMLILFILKHTAFRHSW